MKGKSVFNKEEAAEIIRLIEQKVLADSSKQKGIRKKIRDLGFYAEDFKLRNYTSADFKRVVKIVGISTTAVPTTIKELNPTEIIKDFARASSTIFNFDNEIVNELKANGFKGFTTVSEIIKNNYADTPKVRGIYVLLYHNFNPDFMEVGCGGNFKSKNPNVPTDTLKNNWVDDSSIIYIGKAGAENGSATLHSRLKQYFRFGQGEPVGHWGGRYIWQLKDCYNMIVCWKELPNDDPRTEERKLIEVFFKRYGKRPFANLVG